ncbi:DUF2914 domain-containing protein [Salinispirillum sp. LH 10-3-1]|uniref:DUF2914 domain-containing protein n=1 Tax=Salinispirillum sp. LH 10-3-1 TaxID=2952525 RepID=A0AB38YD28_9GAMM
MKRLMLCLATVWLSFSVAHAGNHGEPVELVGEVARAIFTTGIDDREPVDQLDVIPAGLGSVYLFTDLRDFTGQRVLHRWMYNERVESEVGFNVGGPRWRTWSSKTIPASQSGEWRVDIIDGEGFIVESHYINAE